MKSGARHQRGGALTVIAIVLLALLVGTFALTMGKDYMQYWTVRSIMMDVAKNPGAAQRTPQQLWNEIDRRLSINSIYDAVKRENITYEEHGGGKHMVLYYEVRRPFLGNVDLVATFSRRDTLSP